MRIVFRDGHETRQGAGHAGLRFLEALEGRRVIDQFGRRLDASHARPRLGHLHKNLLLLHGKALYGIDQVRHQVGTALVLVENLGPAGLDLLVDALNVVVAASA